MHKKIRNLAFLMLSALLILPSGSAFANGDDDNLDEFGPSINKMVFIDTIDNNMVDMLKYTSKTNSIDSVSKSEDFRQKDYDGMLPGEEKDVPIEIKFVSSVVKDGIVYDNMKINGTIKALKLPKPDVDNILADSTESALEVENKLRENFKNIDEFKKYSKDNEKPYVYFSNLSKVDHISDKKEDMAYYRIAYPNIIPARSEIKVTRVKKYPVIVENGKNIDKQGFIEAANKSLSIELGEYNLSISEEDINKINNMAKDDIIEVPVTISKEGYNSLNTNLQVIKRDKLNENELVNIKAQNGEALDYIPDNESIQGVIADNYDVVFSFKKSNNKYTELKVIKNSNYKFSSGNINHLDPVKEIREDIKINNNSENRLNLQIPLKYNTEVRMYTGRKQVTSQFDIVTSNIEKIDDSIKYEVSEKYYGGLGTRVNLYMYDIQGPLKNAGYYNTTNNHYGLLEIQNPIKYRYPVYGDKNLKMYISKYGTGVRKMDIRGIKEGKNKLLVGDDLQTILEKIEKYNVDNDKTILLDGDTSTSTNLIDPNNISGDIYDRNFKIKFISSEPKKLGSKEYDEKTLDFKFKVYDKFDIVRRSTEMPKFEPLSIVGTRDSDGNVVYNDYFKKVIKDNFEYKINNKEIENIIINKPTEEEMKKIKNSKGWALNVVFGNPHHNDEDVINYKGFNGEGFNEYVSSINFEKVEYKLYKDGILYYEAYDKAELDENSMYKKPYKGRIYYTGSSNSNPDIRIGEEEKKVAFIPIYLELGDDLTVELAKKNVILPRPGVAFVESSEVTDIKWDEEKFKNRVNGSEIPITATYNIKYDKRLKKEDKIGKTVTGKIIIQDKLPEVKENIVIKTKINPKVFYKDQTLKVDDIKDYIVTTSGVDKFEKDIKYELGDYDTSRLGDGNAELLIEYKGREVRKINVPLRIVNKIEFNKQSPIKLKLIKNRSGYILDYKGEPYIGKNIINVGNETLKDIDNQIKIIENKNNIRNIGKLDEDNRNFNIKELELSNSNKDFFPIGKEILPTKIVFDFNGDAYKISKESDKHGEVINNTLIEGEILLSGKKDYNADYSKEITLGNDKYYASLKFSVPEYGNDVANPLYKKSDLLDLVTNVLLEEKIIESKISGKIIYKDESNTKVGEQDFDDIVSGSKVELQVPYGWKTDGISEVTVDKNKIEVKVYKKDISRTVIVNDESGNRLDSFTVKGKIGNKIPVPDDFTKDKNYYFKPKEDNTIRFYTTDEENKKVVTLTGIKRHNPEDFNTEIKAQGATINISSADMLKDGRPRNEVVYKFVPDPNQDMTTTGKKTGVIKVMYPDFVSEEYRIIINFKRSETTLPYDIINLSTTIGEEINVNDFVKIKPGNEDKNITVRLADGYTLETNTTGRKSIEIIVTEDGVESQHNTFYIVNPVNKTHLWELINKVKNKVGNDGHLKYTQETWEKLIADLTAAQTVYRDGNATKEEVDLAAKNLSMSYDALVEKDDTGGSTGGEDPVDPGKEKTEADKFNPITTELKVKVGETVDVLTGLTNAPKGAIVTVKQDVNTDEPGNYTAILNVFFPKDKSNRTVNVLVTVIGNKTPTGLDFTNLINEINKYDSVIKSDEFLYADKDKQKNYQDAMMKAYDLYKEEKAKDQSEIDKVLSDILDAKNNLNGIERKQNGRVLELGDTIQPSLNELLEGYLTEVEGTESNDNNDSYIVDTGTSTNKWNSPINNEEKPKYTGESTSGKSDRDNNKKDITKDYNETKLEAKSDLGKRDNNESSKSIENKKVIAVNIDNMNKFNVITIKNGKIVNKEDIPVPKDSKLCIKNGRIMMPVRFISELMGYNVEWNQDSKQAVFTKGNLKTTIGLNSKTIKSNDEKVIKLDSKPELINDRMYVPVSKISEALGLGVNGERTKYGSVIYNNDLRMSIFEIVE